MGVLSFFFAVKQPFQRTRFLPIRKTEGQHEIPEAKVFGTHIYRQRERERSLSRQSVHGEWCDCSYVIVRTRPIYYSWRWGPPGRRRREGAVARAASLAAKRCLLACSLPLFYYVSSLVFIFTCLL